jgi:cytochrome bd ubiquinol oxidase subunit II
MTYEFLQQYWWLLISILGALLVFLLFVQGGQTLLFEAGDDMRRTMMVNSLGRKWEFTFTTLVTFGGAFFASFPLFYSTSFGGAYWLWVLILLGFVLQAVSYEFRSKPRNIFGTRTYDIFLLLNGAFGCILLGVAVATFFFGSEFTIEKASLVNSSAPVISQWAPTHGLEAIFCWKNLCLGFVVLFLARTLAAMYFMNNIDDESTFERCRKALLVNGLIFVVLFLVFLGIVLTSDGLQTNPDGTFTSVPFKFFHNYFTMWWVLVILLLGVVLVLYAFARSVWSKHFKYGIWYAGLGTVLVVLTLFWVVGYNATPYYPSLLNPASSLTIYNSSSSYFTLSVMSWVSLFIPFVLAYIIYVWRAMNRKPITPEEMSDDSHKY